MFKDKRLSSDSFFIFKQTQYLLNVLICYNNYINIQINHEY